jgi:hypothetical protein
MQGYLLRYKKPVKYKTNKGGGAGLDQKRSQKYESTRKRSRKPED